MTKDFLVSLGLNDETAEKIASESAKELSNYISAEQHMSEINNLKKENAVDKAILKAKGKDTKIIKAVLNMDKINLKDDGTLENFNLKDDGTLENFNLKDVEKEYPYLFDNETIITVGTGVPKNGNNQLFKEERTAIDRAMGINY